MSIWKKCAASSAAPSPPSSPWPPQAPANKFRSRLASNRLGHPALPAAAFGLALLTGFGAPAQAADPAAQHDQCVSEAETDPEAALARARQWSSQGGGFDADHCAAMALYGLKKYAEAAAAFEKLADGMVMTAPAERARIYDQAGQAWLVAEAPSQAKRDFDAALELAPNDPDLRIDRAEALAALRRYWDALDDLNRASDLAPQRAEIYAYRAAAYRAVDSLNLARQDIEHNLALAPNNPVGLLERGNIRRLAGDVAGARQDWLSVVRLAPGTPSAASANENLTRLGAIRDPAPKPPPISNGPS